jgi:hypothetical protein
MTKQWRWSGDDWVYDDPAADSDQPHGVVYETRDGFVCVVWNPYHSYGLRPTLEEAQQVVEGALRNQP